jgi:hypothetical protein
MPIARQSIVPIELAKAPAEIDVLLARDLLIAEQQDAVIEKRAVNLTERALAHRLAYVDFEDFSPEGVGEAAEF